MITLIIGGSGSGKSEYAEQMALNKSSNELLYYLATMKIYGKEGKEKVKRHKNQRANKGFITIEQSQKIEDVLEKIEDNSTVLLECMSNLVANEMFSSENKRDNEQIIRYILKGIELLGEKAKNLIIVTNNVFEDGILYEESTLKYIEVLGQINYEIAKKADEIVEVVVGIPIYISKSRRKSHD